MKIPVSKIHGSALIKGAREKRFFSHEDKGAGIGPINDKINSSPNGLRNGTFCELDSLSLAFFRINAKGMVGK